MHRELLKSIRLDLAHPLARDPELAADRLERSRVAVAVQAVAELQHLAIAVRQVGERAMQQALLEADGDLLLGRGLLAGEQIAEGTLALLADRPVEARHRACRGAHLAHLLQRQLGVLRNLLLGRRAAELRRELALRAAD